MLLRTFALALVFSVAGAGALGTLGCNGGADPSTTATNGSDGSGAGSPSGGQGGDTGAGSSGSTSSTTGAGSSGSGGSEPFVCTPAAEPGSLFELSALAWDFSLGEVSMCKYRGDVMLIVNTAAKCGYTPQYAPLEQLEQNYAAQGLHVLGFLSNDFAQAGSEDDINKCTEQYGVTFEQFDLVHVKIGQGQHPIFQWLTSRPGFPGNVTWNFNKWLVGRDGSLLGRWTEHTDPDSNEVVSAIEAALAASP
jgi:glutathione peroxidase